MRVKPASGLARRHSNDSSAATSEEPEQQHQHQQQQQHKPRPRGRPRKRSAEAVADSDSEYAAGSADEPPDSGSSSMSSDDSVVRAVRRQRRRRSNVPISGDAGCGRAGKGHASSGHAAWRQPSSGQLADGLPESLAAGFGGQEQWQHPAQLVQVQRPRTGMQRVAASQPGICTHAPLQLPAMPHAPRQPGSTQAVVDWLKALPDFRHSLASHLEAVDFVTELAINECQRYIQQLQQQRLAREQQAKQYLHTVVGQARQVLASVELEEQGLEADWPQLQQPDALMEEQQAEQQQEQLAEQEVWTAGAAWQPEPAAAPSGPEGAAGGLHTQQLPLSTWQQTGLLDTQGAPVHPKEESLSAGPAVVQESGSAMGPAALPQPSQQATTDSQTQLRMRGDQHQPAAAAGGSDDDGAALPFPGGPAWGLVQWTGRQ